MEYNFDLSLRYLSCKISYLKQTASFSTIIGDPDHYYTYTTAIKFGVFTFSITQQDL